VMSDQRGSEEREIQALAAIEAYLDRLGWRYETEGDGFRVQYRGSNCELAINIELDADYLSIIAPGVIKVEDQARAAVLERAMKIQWETCIPKFEWNPRDDELRVCYYLPLADGLPSYPEFEQVVRGLCETTDECWEALLHASRERRAVSAEDRVRGAAELSALGRNLVHLATKREILPMYVREDLVEQLIALLDGPEQRVLLVGEPGTGKNALVHALATWIAADDSRVQSTSLRQRPIYECTPSSFQLSCHYVHELETKMQLIADNCRDENAVLFIDEINLAITAASLSEGHDRTVANLLLPYLSRNEIATIGATTPDGYKYMLRNNPRFANEFARLEVWEPDMDDSVRMVEDRIAKLSTGAATGRTHAFSRGLERTVVEVAGRWLKGRRFPGKGLELLNEVVATAGGRATTDPVSDHDVYETLRTRTGLREEIVLPERALAAEDVREALSDEVLGQPAAVETIVNVVLQTKADVAATDRPIGCLFFAGPTGVGKTQLARSTAKYLFDTEDRLLRYDMSEYASADGFLKLCGSAGQDREPGRLVSEVRAMPFSVLLFDEIEKAHSRVFNALLQVLGEGRMTDEAGQTVSFLNCVIILTSNVGSHLYTQGAIGFGQASRARVPEQRILDEIAKTFPPEFVNRLSAIVCFQPLDEETVRAIAQREVEALAQRRGFADRNLALTFEPEIIDLLCERGFDARYGARAMQRAVANLLLTPLAGVLAAQPDLRDTQLHAALDGATVRVEVRSS